MFIVRIAGIGAVTCFISTVAMGQGQLSSNARGAVPQARAQSSGVQPSDVTSRAMTLRGCLIKESDDRRAHGLGKGDLSGLATGSDFVLVDASVVSGAQGTNPSEASAEAIPSAASEHCTEKGTGAAYRMAGKREGELKPYVGQYVEIAGRVQHARDERIAAGETKGKMPPEDGGAPYPAPPAPPSGLTPTTPPPN